MTDPIIDGGGGRSIRNGLLMLGFGLFSAAVIIVWLAVFGKALSFALSPIAHFPALAFLGKTDAESVLSRLVRYAADGSLYRRPNRLPQVRPVPRGQAAFDH